MSFSYNVNTCLKRNVLTVGNLTEDGQSGQTAKLLAKAEQRLRMCKDARGLGSNPISTPVVLCA